MNKNKRIIFCVPPTCGGAERVTLTFAKQLDIKLYNILIVVIGNEKGDIIDFIPSGVSYTFLKTKNIWDFTTLKLFRLFKKKNPNIVFCSLMYLNTRVIVAAKLAGGISVVVRNNISFSRMGLLNSFLIRCFYPMADKIVLQTDEMDLEMRSCLANSCHKKFVVIPNPIDTERIKQCVNCINVFFDKSFVNFIYVGRIEFVKGIDVLIKAFSIVHKKIDNAKLYIVGKADDRNEYYKQQKNIVNDNQLSNNVIWTGFTNNPYAYIKQADCFVLPSRVEGLPNVVLEAMYLKIPVVVTKSVPIIERIVPKERGILVEINNPTQMADAMIKASHMKIINDFELYDNSRIVELFNKL